MRDCEGMMRLVTYWRRRMATKDRRAGKPAEKSLSTGRGVGVVRKAPI